MKLNKNIKAALDDYKSGKQTASETADIIFTVNTTEFIPALDLLQSRLESGCEISFEDGRWCLFDNDGEGVTSGETVREMLVNLIFTDC